MMESDYFLSVMNRVINTMLEKYYKDRALYGSEKALEIFHKRAEEHIQDNPPVETMEKPKDFVDNLVNVCAPIVMLMIACCEDM